MENRKEPKPRRKNRAAAPAPAAPAPGSLHACACCGKAFQRVDELKHHVEHAVCRSPDLDGSGKKRKMESDSETQADEGMPDQEVIETGTDEDESGTEIPTESPRRSLPRRRCTQTRTVRYRDEDSQSDESSLFRSPKDEHRRATLKSRRQRRKTANVNLSDSSTDERDYDSSAPVTDRKRSRANRAADESGSQVGLSGNKGKARRLTDDDESATGSDLKRKRKRPKVSQLDPPNGWQCPHCNKPFKQREGYQYHVDKRVCHKRPPEARIPREKRKISLDLLSAYPKVQGKKADRTCPICKRVFSGPHGLKYHLEKRVCLNSKSTTNEGPFPLLQPGSLFVTKYGVVRVIADDRATPTATLSENFKQETRNYGHMRVQHEAKIKRFNFTNTVQHVSKRSKLSKLYEGEDITQQSVFSVSIGVAPPSVIKTFDSLSVLPPDPGEPEGSFPDRIVECEVIPDARLRFRDDTYEEIRDLRHQDLVGCKMFLQRRLLTTPYIEHVDLYRCSQCGQEYSNMPGIKYHVQREVCMIRSKNALDAMKSRMQSLLKAEEEPDSALKRRIVTTSSEPMDMLSNVSASSRHVFKRRKEKSVDHVSVYPQVYLALGFKLLPRSVVTARQSRVSAFRAPMEDSMVEYSFENAEQMDGSIVVHSNASVAALSSAASDSVEDPRIVLADLERQLTLENAKQLGPVYPFVWNSLCFSTGKKSARRRKKARRASTSSRRSEQDEQPAIIDTSVLVEEIESGRYPSLKRNDSTVVHEPACLICDNDDPPLLPCQFCTASAHTACMLAKVIVKEVDKDDFMCSKCITYVGHMRKRAERRRLERQNSSNNGGGETDEMELLTTLVKGREYDSLVAQTRRIAELTELLDDAKTRLTQNMEANRLDLEYRYSAIESCERLAQLAPMAWNGFSSEIKATG